MAFHRDTQYLGKNWKLVTLTTLAERHCCGVESGSDPQIEGVSDLLNRLEIFPRGWEQVTELWRPRAKDIAELANQFK
ncbi:MAG: hypothetical protein ABF297_11600 [Thiogranum sp.]